ncbi:MAG: helix-turn-helix domain-containing protein [Pseudomonadota bacterium]
MGKSGKASKTRSASDVKKSAGTRRERVESKESAIVSVAYEMFAAKGFARSTIAEIAKAAGVAEGTVYLYFNNKEALARAVVASFYERLTEAARAGAHRRKTTRSKLEFLARHHLESILAEARILQLLSILDRDAGSDAGGAVYQLNKTYVAVFDEVVRAGVWRGDIAEGFAPWIMRDIFYGALEYAMRTMMITGREGEIDRFAKQLVAMIANDAGRSAAAGHAVVDAAALSALADRFDAAATRLETVLENDDHDRD